MTQQKTETNLTKVQKKQIHSWCMYDWANSAIATSLMVAILPPYIIAIFKSTVGESTTFLGLNMTGSLYEVDDYGRGSFVQIKNLILPAITLGIRPLSVIIQLCRNSLLEVLSMDYIRTATAKGLSKFQVIFKHALRNALNPVVTAVSGWFASMLAGAVFVEYIFWNCYTIF